jgi:hypothetical protein
VRALFGQHPMEGRKLVGEVFVLLLDLETVGDTSAI